jgi:hypothetical protein
MQQVLLVLHREPTMVAPCFIEVSRAWDNYIDSANATLLNQQGPLSPEK